ERINRARARRDAFGAFASAEVDLARGLALAAGVRWDGIRGGLSSEAGMVPSGRSDLSAASPSLTLNRRLGRSGNAFLSVSRSFKAPTLEQLFDRRPFFLAPYLPPLYLSNDALLPQRAWNVELGLRTRLGNRAWTDLALYSLKVRDEIGFDLAHLRYDNIDRSVHQGVEWNLTAYPTDHLRPRLAYVLSRATFDGGANRGNQINGVPRHQATAALAWLEENGAAGGPGAGLWAEVSLHHVRGQFIDEANRLPLAPYTILDAAAGYRFRRFPPIGSLGIELTARNLTDERFTPEGFVSLDQRGQPLPLYYPGSRRSVAGLLRVER
ncbi:MAG TPA: TonB-dependent receptor, partial [Thermoanaerobaculia bacterium]|nr:TonB-dependent receptor [Thermoanaerobaculia bacterium]